MPLDEQWGRDRRASATGLAVRLLGRPSIGRPGKESYRLRSRKSWALLAYLLLAERVSDQKRSGGAVVRRGG